MGNLFRDLRQALRLLRKRPSFSAVAVVSLALGIGANTAIFGVINAVLLRPLPFGNPGRLVQILSLGGKGPYSVSAPNYEDFRDQGRAFEGMAAYNLLQSFNLTGDHEPERVPGAIASANFFSVLDVAPSLGRGFAREDGLAGGEPVVILSHALWARRFGSDPGLVGRSIVVDGVARDVVGVMPPAFRFGSPEIWIPLREPADPAGRGNHFLRAVGRLKPGVTLAQARADLGAVASRLALQYPGDDGDLKVSVTPLRDEIVGETGRALLVLFGVTAFVLLIACANVANMLLARGIIREKEFAIRMALGASRRQLIRQLLTESLLLGLAGGALGMLLALWGTDVLAAMGGSSLPLADRIGVDRAAFVFTLAISVLSVAFFGLVPAFQASRMDPRVSLNEPRAGLSGGMRGRGWRSVIITAEVALAILSLSGAGLLLKSFHRLVSVDPGFRSEGILTAALQLPARKYSSEGSLVQFCGQLLERVRGLPDVKSVGAISHAPLGGDDAAGSFRIVGRPADQRGGSSWTKLRAVSPDYFLSMGIPVLRGRDFSAQDRRDGQAVAIIDETMARQFFAGEDPIGRRLIADFAPDVVREIVGVVGGVHHKGLDVEPAPQLYLPFTQQPLNFMTLVIRSSNGGTSLAADLRRAVWSLDRDLPISAVRTIEETMDLAVARPRFTASLLSILALLALALAAVGIYGVVSYAVSRRTREIGIRVALGARRRDVLTLVLGEGMVQVVAGVALGLAGSVALRHTLDALLFEVSSGDPSTFAAVPGLVFIAYLLACWIPAHRALMVDPMVAVRYE